MNQQLFYAPERQLQQLAYLLQIAPEFTALAELPSYSRHANRQQLLIKTKGECPT